jgi:hypothetical protein
VRRRFRGERKERVLLVEVGEEGMVGRGGMLTVEFSEW